MNRGWITVFVTCCLSIFFYVVQQLRKKNWLQLVGVVTIAIACFSFFKIQKYKSEQTSKGKYLYGEVSVWF